MRHGAQRQQAHAHGLQHIAGARQLSRRSTCLARAAYRAQLGGQHTQNLFVPGARKTAPCAVVGNLEVAQARHTQLGNLGVQAPAAFVQIRRRLGVAKVHLVDDGQHRDLEQDGVQPRPLNHDLQLARGQRRDRDVFLVELEQAQKVHKVAFDKAQRTQVGQFLILKTQAAETANFLPDVIGMGRQVHPGVAALEAVLHLGARKLVQHHLHHGELVQVGVQKAGDDHGVTGGAAAAPFLLCFQ